MATLAVRPLTPLDLPALRHVRQRCDQLLLPTAPRPLLPDGAQRALATIPANWLPERAYVALVDGELCAMIELRPSAEQFRWDLVALSAGSPRLEANDDVCAELWLALLEYAIQRAGEARAKRLFAAAEEGYASYRALRAAGFEPYSRATVMSGVRAGMPIELPTGMRMQEPSDVWSIHQLYSHVTPRAVQFAEAQTSDAWELPRRSTWKRVARAVAQRDSDPRAFVLDSGEHGIIGYCRVERVGVAATLHLIVSQDAADRAVPFALAAANDAGIGARCRLRLTIPGYASELIGRFEAAGFIIEDERHLLVRHTTAPAVVHARLAPLPADARERVPRGVPSYYRNSRPVISRNSGACWRPRMECSSN